MASFFIGRIGSSHMKVDTYIKKKAVKVRIENKKSLTNITNKR